MLWTMPLPANIVLRNFGLAMFLATVGVNAGQPFVRTVAESGFTMLFIGVAVLLTTVSIVLLVGHYVMKIPYDDLVGVASGATGNPAILVYSTKMAPTERPDIGYAMIFPSMTLVKVIAAQIVGLLTVGSTGGYGIPGSMGTSRMTEPVPAPQLPIFNLQAYSPAEIKEAVEKVGVEEGQSALSGLLHAGDRRGGGVGFGALYYTIVASDATLSFATIRVLGRLAFTLGLALVLVGGAELFTGNNLIVMAWASGKVSTRTMLRNWTIVYFGNLVGALGLIVLAVC